MKDCNNYIDDSDNNLFRFFPNYKNDRKWNNLYFQTNDPSELEMKIISQTKNLMHLLHKNILI